MSDPNTTTLSYYTTSFLQSVDVGFGSVNLLCFTFGFPGNLLSMCYFNHRSRDLSSILYLINSLNDAIICFLSVFSIYPFFHGRDPGAAFSSDTLCLIFSYLFIMSMRTSIFLVVVLTLARTIALLFPFRRFPRIPFILSVPVYELLVLGQFLIWQLSGRMDYAYMRASGNCAFYSGGSRSIISEVIMAVSYIIPVVVVSVFTVVTAHLMLHPPAVLRATETTPGRRYGTAGTLRRRATVTLILFAGIYLFFNAPMAIYLILQTVSLDFHRWDDKFYYVNFVLTLSVSINAALNPLLYAWRMHSYRKHALRVVCTFRRVLTCGSFKPPQRFTTSYDMTKRNAVARL